MSPAELELVVTVWVLFAVACLHPLKRHTTYLVGKRSSGEIVVHAGERFRLYLPPFAPWNAWVSLCSTDLQRRVTRERREQWRRFTAIRPLLARISALQSVLLLFVVPSAIATFGLPAIWRVVALTLLVVHAAIVCVFVRAHRSVYGSAGSGERTEATIALMLYPISGMRAVDILARSLMRDIAVLHAAELTMPRERFIQLLRYEYFERPGRGKEILHGIGSVTEAELLREPARDEATVSFCPRCHTQFTIAQGECSDCQVALKLYENLGSRA